MKSEAMEPEQLSDVMSEFARTMVTDFPIQGILDHLVKRIVDVMPVTAAGVTLISPGLDPRYVAASNESALRFEKLQTKLGEGPCLAAYHTGDAISVPDLRSEQRFPRFVPEALAAGLAAVFTFPLNHGSLRLGALDLYRDDPGRLSPSSLRAAQTLADVAAAYLINAQGRSDLQDSSDQSRAAALHDALTGLPNRVLMLELLEHAFRASRRSGKTSAVFFLDIDRFKDVNDTYGHQVGDDLLRAVAQRLTAVLRPGDSLARLSGDEFVMLCENLDDPSQADPIAVRVNAELSERFILSGAEINVTASIGVAFTGQGTDAAEELLHDADLAMYRAKRDRVGSHDVFDLRELHLVGHQSGLARGLPGAAQRGELHLDYQPIVATHNGQLTAVEALLRWTHPDRGPVAPTAFIPLAEQSGQIIELGRWVLDQTCGDRQYWQIPQRDGVAVWVNVSAHQFLSAGFAETVATGLANGSIDPGLLTLEVTAGVLARDDQRALVVLQELKTLGVKIALDDFGTGYSSLGYLDSLPIDTIKIGQTFVAKLTGGPDTRTTVNAIIDLAHRLGMTVVCEGVETRDQHHHLRQLGSDYCQGFYFAKPMPAARMATHLARHTNLPHSPSTQRQ